MTVAPDVAHDNIPCKHHTDTTKAPFLHVDVFIVIPLITCGEERRFAQQPDARFSVRKKDADCTRLPESASDETPRGLRIKSERKQRVLVKHSVSASQKKR